MCITCDERLSAFKIVASGTSLLHSDLVLHRKWNRDRRFFDSVEFCSNLFGGFVLRFNAIGRICKSPSSNRIKISPFNCDELINRRFSSWNVLAVRQNCIKSCENSSERFSICGCLRVRWSADLKATLADPVERLIQRYNSISVSPSSIIRTRGIKSL